MSQLIHQAREDDVIVATSLILQSLETKKGKTPQEKKSLESKKKRLRVIRNQEVLRQIGLLE